MTVGGRLDRVLSAYLAASRLVIVTVSVAALVLMVALNGLEIVARGVFGHSYSFVQEASILAAMWVYFFAYALIAKNDEYIRVDFTARLMPASWQLPVEVLSRLVTIGFHMTIVWFGVETFRFLGLFTTPILEWPESIFVLPILLGAADIVLTECIRLYRQISGVAA